MSYFWNLPSQYILFLKPQDSSGRAPQHGFGDSIFSMNNFLETMFAQRRQGRLENFQLTEAWP